MGPWTGRGDFLRPTEPISSSGSDFASIRPLAGYEHKQGTVTPGEAGTFHLSLHHDELLTQQGVFKHRFRFGTGTIQGRAYSQGIGAVIGACPLV